MYPLTMLTSSGTNKSARKKEEACPIKKKLNTADINGWFLLTRLYENIPFFTHGKLRLMLHFFYRSKLQF